MNQSDFRPFDGPQPIYVSLPFSIWWPEQHSPSVVVYEDGRIIYTKWFKEKGTEIGHRYEAVLSKPDLATIYALMEPIQKLKKLKSHYRLTNVPTDGPESRIYVHSKNGPKRTQIEGFHSRLKRDELAYSKTDAPVIGAFFNMYHYVENLQPAQGKPWTPKYIKLLFRKERKPEPEFTLPPRAPAKSRKVVNWPKEWPSFASPQVSRQENGYTLFLDAAQWAKLRPVPPISNDALIRIQGKIYEVLQDEVYPREPEWYQAFGIVE
ncbi:hypothetical protein [Armatimonas sp.]|uniref:hypothetical protein n=1 Tax=Armatimonas sp. TaxID=1872638 RepID=UPI00286C7C54|nr:hypothetical protein [Armatimonas sp.]